MNDVKKKSTVLKLKKSVDNPSIENEVEQVINAIKDDKIKNGDLPKTSKVVIHAFAGKVLKRTKSFVLGNAQYFLNQGTVWEDIEPFYRKHLVFSAEDFE